jgi:hypothetical protein
MFTSAPARRAPQIVLTMKLSAPDKDALLDVIGQISGQMDDPDRIAAICLDEDACCAELDVAARPVDPRRLH